MRIFEIKDYPEYQLYYSDEEQKVYSKKREKYLKNILNKDGYYYVSLYNSEGVKLWRLNRLVWYVFNGEIPEGLQVNHINENKLDNRISNLNLMTPKQNCNWGSGIQRHAEKLLNHKNLSTPIIGVHKKTYNIIEFPSIMEAERTDKRFFHSHISACCKHKERKTVIGYYFFYKDEFDELLEKFNGNIQSIIEYKISLY